MVAGRARRRGVARDYRSADIIFGIIRPRRGGSRLMWCSDVAVLSNVRYFARQIRHFFYSPMIHSIFLIDRYVYHAMLSGSGLSCLRCTTVPNKTRLATISIVVFVLEISESRPSSIVIGTSCRRITVMAHREQTNYPKA